jgi:hypothetical protein
MDRRRGALGCEEGRGGEPTWPVLFANVVFLRGEEAGDPAVGRLLGKVKFFRGDEEGDRDLLLKLVVFRGEGGGEGISRLFRTE